MASASSSAGSRPAARLPRAAVRRRHALTTIAFVELPLIAALWLAWIAVHSGGAFGDFLIFRNAGHALISGHSPYVHPTASLLRENDHFVYPTPFAVPFIPFALLPVVAAKLVWFAVSLGALGGALWLFGVRDRRCYGLALLTPPVFGALFLGALGPWLLLFLALGWRYRDRPLGGVMLALAAAAKIFLWPVLVWLLITRRFRSAVASGLTLIGLFAVWSAIDLDGLRQYPRTLQVLDEVQRWKSYSLQSLAISLHFPASAGSAVTAVLAVAGLAVVFVLAREPNGDRRSFATAVGVALLVTPILWLHYLVLLLAPLALLRPRFGPAWLLLLAFWVSPHPESLGSDWRIAITLLLTVTLVVVTVERPRSVRRALTRPPVAPEPLAGP